MIENALLSYVLLHVANGTEIASDFRMQVLVERMNVYWKQNKRDKFLETLDIALNHGGWSEKYKNVFLPTVSTDKQLELRLKLQEEFPYSAKKLFEMAGKHEIS